MMSDQENAKGQPSESKKINLEVMQYRGKSVDTSMSKNELIEVIKYLATEMNYFRSENYKYSSAIYDAKLKELVKK